MDIVECVRARRSIRGYRPEPVPEGIIREILEISIQSPSAVNTQPWEFTVVAGEVLDQIRRGNVKKLLSGSAPGKHVPGDGYRGVYKKRQVELAVDIFKLMKISRGDREKREEWLQRGFRFFDAPAAIIIAVDESLDGTLALFDLGAVSQTICLVAMKYGLGTCIEAMGVMFPEVIRHFTGIPENKSIMMSIALGYPDGEFPANKLKSRREPVESLSTWHGFAGLRPGTE